MRSISAIAIISCALLVAACGVRQFREQRLAISRDSSIPVSIVVCAGKEPDWDGLFDYIGKESDLFDYRNPDGPVAEINGKGNATPPKEVFSLIALAVSVAERTGGAFDPTILPLTRLWSTDTLTRLPDERSVLDAVRLVDYTKIMIGNDGTVNLPAGMSLDLGGIAKGEIVDRTADRLESAGADGYLIEAGGDIIVKGLKPGNEKWKIGIEHPRDRGKLIDTLIVGETGKRLAVVTSGDYERFVIIDGKRYHHIIDPRTGYPAEGVISVTVIAPTCALADGLSTGAFVLGFDKGVALLEDLADVEGFVIRENNGKLETGMTSGFAAYLTESQANP